MKKVQEKPDWLEARTLKTREEHDYGGDMFQGGSKTEFFEYQGTRVIRLSAWSKGEESAPQSFAVVLPEKAESDVLQSASEIWYQYESESLPLNFNFMQVAEDHFRFRFDLEPGTCCYGLGERLSGTNLKGRSHTLFNYSDNRHIPSLDTMYLSVPFLIIEAVNGDPVESHAKTRGIFLDSPAWQKWCLDEKLNGEGTIDLLSRRGWTLYLLEAENLPDLLAAYTNLTGRGHLPPDWSLGYHQSRWSYPDAKTILDIGTTIREKSIPCDSVVLDIDYMDEYRVFTHSKERFPDFKGTVDKLLSMNLKTTCIVDPGVKKEEKFSVYSDGKKRDFFCRRGDNKPFIGKAWPGPSLFPDFLRHDVRVWWSAMHGFFVDNNVAGVWNDMNEPCLLEKPCPMPPDSKTLPGERRQMFLQSSPEGKVGHFEVRNLYGMQMARASYEGLLALRPDERPFVLTRAGYAGIQRYSAVWLGDNMSWWEHLALSIPMLINMGLSGIPFNGVDVGGFGDDCSNELLIRWYELGIFYPFFRNHSSMEGVVQEPWVFGAETEAKIRHLIQWRYRLLPYIKRLFLEHCRNGAPLIRPMFWSHPEDPNTRDIDDQFFFGDDILVAPITRRGQTARAVYFPEGDWFPLDPASSDRNNSGPIKGGRYVRVENTLGQVPAFARSGAIIPMVAPIQSTAEYESAEIIFKTFSNECIGLFSEDDGISFEYENRGYNEWLLRYTNGKFSAQCTNYGYIAPERDYFVETPESGKEPVNLPRPVA